MEILGSTKVAADAGGAVQDKKTLLPGQMGGIYHGVSHSLQARISAHWHARVRHQEQIRAKNSEGKSTFCSIFLRVLVSLSGATSQEQSMVASSVFLDQGGKDHVVA